MSVQEIQEKFGGKWKLDRSENFEEYLRAMGTGLVKRKMASKLPLNIEISVEGDKVKILSKAPIKTLSFEAKLNEEVILDTVCRKEKTSLSYEDGKLIMTCVPVDPDLETSKIEREIINGELVQTMSVGDVKCTRTFCRVE